MQRVGGQLAAVQPRYMARINAAFHRLQVVVFLQPLGHITLRVGDHGPLELGRRRHVGGRPHIGPDDAAALDAGIGLQLDPGAQIAARGLGGNLNALARGVVFPAVVGAADAALFIATEPQRHTPVRAELVDHAQASGAVAKGNHALGQQLQAHWRAVRKREFLGQQRGLPVAPKKLAHRGAGAGLGQEVVLFGFEHLRRRLVLRPRGRADCSS